MTANLPIVRISDAPVYKLNPAGDIAIDRRKKITVLKSNVPATAADWQTGEITEGSMAFVNAETVDRERFVKVYLEGMNAYERLKTTGRKVFMLLFAQMRENMNQPGILLSRAAARRHNITINESDFTRGIIQLINCEFIWRSEDANMYWINPEYMFNGNRITFVKQYRLAQSASQHPLKTELMAAARMPDRLTLKPIDPDQAEIEDAIANANEAKP